MVPRIRIIDDQPGQPLGAHVKEILGREDRYSGGLQGPFLDGTEALDPHVDLTICILPASKERARQFVAKLRRNVPRTPLLPIIQGANLNPMAAELLPGTADFLCTPLQEAELLARVRCLLAGSREQECASVHTKAAEGVKVPEYIGEDPAFVNVKRKIPLLARCEVPVLLVGETGTGKEICARALHYSSRRSGKPFLPVNCGAIPLDLFESELFGHRKGAFTGAWTAQPGLITEAEGGTLFLDEIETLSPGAQAKLLRFLDDQTYHPLGSPRPRQADVWILASTNVDLIPKVRTGTFREDLYYRLAVMTLSLPPLRDRRVDIPLLVAHFWTRYAKQRGGRVGHLSPRAMGVLCQYSWPGNVRELKNVIQQVVMLSDAHTIEPEDLPILHLPASGESRPISFKRERAQVIEQFEKTYITKLLRMHQGNVTRAAQAAHMERRAFGRLIKRYQIAKQ